MHIMYYYYAALVVVTLATLEVTGEDNEWLILSKEGQNSINNAITNIKSYGASDDKVKSLTDKAYDEFVKYVKNGIIPTKKKFEENPSEENNGLNVKLNKWAEELEDKNSVSDKYKNSQQNSFKKFEDTIADMVKFSPKMAETIKSAKPENREILLDFGIFMKDAITKLVTTINTAESQLKSTGNAVSK